MRLLRRTSSMGGGGGGRGLRRVDSLPRSPVALAPRASLAKSESVKKRDKKKGSRRARLRAGISAALRELHLGGGHHCAGRRREERGGGGGDDEEAASVAAPAAVGVALLHAFPDAEARPAAASGGRRSWALAVALLVLVLACVVALGRGPAICCCTCAAWWCGGSSADPTCRRRWSGGRHSSEQRTGCLQH